MNGIARNRTPPHHRSLCTHSGSGVGWDEFGDKGKSTKEFFF